MKLGLFMMPIHHPSRDYHAVLAEDLECIRLADKLGYDEVWVGEHITARTEQITSPLIFLASLIPQTERIKLGTGVINLPHHHPAYVAGHAAMFDHLSEGRFLMGIGTGGLVCDFELFKTLEVENRLDMLTESIDMILKIWDSDPPYRLPGKYWDVQVTDQVRPELGIGPMAKPFQRPHPPIAISVMSPYSSSARLAGERGWGMISANFTPAGHVKTHWIRYAEGCEKAGREPDPGRWHVARSIVVAETDSQARDFAFDPDGALAFYFKYLRDQLVPAGLGKMFKADPDLPDEALTIDYCIDAMVIHGSPKTVAERIVALREEIGDFGTLIFTAHDWTDEARWTRAMALMTDQVMPQVRRATAAA